MTNPLLADWQTPYGLPPFAEIENAHYLPAFDAAMQQHLAEITAIEDNPATPDFDNTIASFDRAGKLLGQIGRVFFALTSGHTNPGIQEIQEAISPLWSAHWDGIYTRQKLFKRMALVRDAIMQGSATQDSQNTATTSVTEEMHSLTELLYQRFIRAGSHLDAETRGRIIAIGGRLSQLQTRYGRNVLDASNAWHLILTESETDGLPASVKASAAREASAAGHEGKYLFSISRSSFTPFMTWSTNREAREKLWRAYTEVATHDQTNNHPVAEEIARLRAERANLLGFETHADYELADRMAATPSAVRELLDQIREPAWQRFAEERKRLQAAVQAEGGNFSLAPWDWWHYAEKVRAADYEMDSEALRQYFPLDRVRQGAFDVANRLYGLTFQPVDDVTLYHDDAQAYEVREADGSLVGLFITDYFMRPSKKAGAWMNAFQTQTRNGDEVRPVILNTCNFTPADPCLLSLEEVNTLFHEFGHGLHGLLSNVTYSMLSGTAVKRDFVELPSQIMEHWAFEPSVLKTYARHIETGETIPDALIEKIRQSATFNQGFATTEYLAASYLDLDWHQLTQDDEVNAEALEQKAMAGIGLPAEIAPRYRSSYFQHIFSGGYSAGYYAYIWAEVLDADAFEMFREKGIFDQETAAAFREHILEKGGSADPMALYERFRGRQPTVTPLLQGRGLG
ncbi:MAG: M3 family metallopeptidase [Pseudomonadales bacterium]|nr:M3 family metallopeptidase [Pseudomonadales bacterium]